MSWDFAILLLLMAILLIVHEYGHYIAYRVLGYKAVVRRSLLVPGIDPLNTIEVNRAEGLLIALGGFYFFNNNCCYSFTLIPLSFVGCINDRKCSWVNF